MIKANFADLTGSIAPIVPILNPPLRYCLHQTKLTNAMLFVDGSVKGLFPQLSSPRTN